MRVASVVVRTRPDRVEPLRGEIAGIPGAEVHAVQAEGRLVVTLDDRDGASPSDAIVQLHNLGGVLGVSLVYEYSDEYH